jgi:hypothetical protein
MFGAGVRSAARHLKKYGLNSRLCSMQKGETVTALAITIVLLATVPTTVVLAIGLDVMAVVSWMMGVINGRLERRPDAALAGHSLAAEVRSPQQGWPAV